MTIHVTVTNKEPAIITGLVQDIPNGGGFLYNGGKLYVKIDTIAFCPENSNINPIGDFAGMQVPLRDVDYGHKGSV